MLSIEAENLVNSNCQTCFSFQSKEFDKNEILLFLLFWDIFQIFTEPKLMQISPGLRGLAAGLASPEREDSELHQTPGDRGHLQG